MPHIHRSVSWEPTYIDIEFHFTEFVSTYRSGRTVCDLVPDIPDGIKNADYYFSEDNVIVELKRLAVDASDPKKFGQRVAAAYKHFSYSGSDFLGWLFRSEPMPEKVRKRVSATFARSIIKPIQDANKQLRATKRLLNEPTARGLTLIANDGNYAFDPTQMMLVMCDGFRKMTDCHTDGIVYFTPNVYHDMGDHIAHEIWLPVYNVGSEDFADWVNDFGKAWGDYSETLGDPYVSRESGEDLFEKIASARPIKWSEKPKKQKP